MRRIILALAAASALSIPTAVAVAGSSAPAWAASGITCSSAKGTASSTLTIGKCSPETKAQKKTDKSASAPAVSLATGGTLTWSSSGLTTIFSVTVTSPGQGGCKPKNTEEDANGTVTGGTSDLTHVGDTVSGRACVSSKGKISLVKGTSFTL